MFGFKNKKQVKIQDLSPTVCKVHHITSPNGKYVELIDIMNLSQYEYDDGRTDYCAIDGNKVYISSKASYDRVCIHSV